MTAQGEVPATNQINLAIGLPLRDSAGLTSFLKDVYDPSSPNYRHFLSTAEFASRFGPSEADYQAVMDFAQSHGLTVKKIYANRMVVDVTGPAANVENAFGVTLRVYPRPAEKGTFYAPDTAPSVPASLPILDVSGLSSYSRPHPKYQWKPVDLPGNVQPKLGSAPGGGYVGDDFRNAYLPGVTQTGKGQKVALVQFEGYYPDDIASYEALAGRTSVPLTNILINGFSGTPAGTGGDVEVTLDIDMVIAMAPGVDLIMVYEGDPFNFHPNDVLNQIATDNAARQVSCSWGWKGGPNATTEQIFQQMAAQGQSFFNASGDSDAFPAGFLDDPFQFGTPSASPNITQVGGTTLSTTGPGGKWASETVWNWGGGVGSSGGVSDYFSIPDWQQGIDMGANGGSTTGRNVPDVALTGDNVFIFAYNGQYGVLGGTSCAAPLWGGLMALINQEAAANGFAPVGFINPSLYNNIGRTTNYAACFHDIKTGNNFSPDSPTKYRAVSGYDLCTGWGTPAGTNLIEVLSLPELRNGFLTLTVSPDSGSALIANTNQTIAINVLDVYRVTNATVTATINGTNLVALDDGTGPDAVGGDGIYTASFDAPNAPASLVMTVSATATNEIGVTNQFYYDIVALPPNDNFANATKVPAAGGSYEANNRFATLEIDEPLHGGDAKVAASLWWSFTPTVSTNILVDTTGSRVENVLAVYTNNTLISLTSVAATNSTLTQGKPARLSFAAHAGTAYRIAVASASTNALGTVWLHVVPGGVADTTAPQVTIASPQSGQTVTNSPVRVSGTAVDLGLNTSGIRSVLVSVNGHNAYLANGTTNWNVLVNLGAGFNTITVQAMDEAGNLSTSAVLELNYLVISAPNDFFAQAIALSGDSGTNSANTVNATKEADEPDHAGNSGGKSVWWKFQPATDGALSLSTFNSDFDTLLAVYTGDVVSDLTPVAANDDAYPSAPGGYSSLTVAVHSNVVYHIALDGYGGVSGTNAVLSYSFTPGTIYHVAIGSTTGGTTDPTALDAASNTTVTITALPASGYVFDSWSGDAVSQNNPLSLTVTRNMNVTAHFVPIMFTDGFESGDFSALNWTTGGDAPWVVQTNSVATGKFAAQAGAIGDNQTSSLMLTKDLQAGPISFELQVSSESPWDNLQFFVDGALVQQWSGDIVWRPYVYNVANPGTHTLEWRYAKDSSGSSGLDTAFLDDLNLPLTVIPDATAPAYLKVKLLGNGNFNLQVTGQINQTYWVQVSTDLKNWQTISTNVATGGSIQISGSIDPSIKARFYRAIVPATP
ncbi:MAG TPA: protease pro-enzyme activation domain-containing protein [Dongiaceae bacterium]|nr:protease pro-enzyme activation domain-containing protein [Dongiaceae bacterium]